MQDLIGSVRRSLVFRTPGGEDGGGGAFGGLVEKIGSSIRNSRIGLFSKPPPVRALPPPPKLDAPAMRWRKGDLIGCGAFGRVYMGMNLECGELIAVKQVLIAANASKEKTQAHIRELEEEVKLLKNLSHPNIVRYMGTVREEDSLNILLEFVPGGSLSSLLGKLGSFPETVIRTYTKQLLLGLEYLHNNGIMHRDIKGANILVDNKGCIKLADFGASKKVVELATINGAKSMKGTPYWMAPEVILQTGHSFSADIWSVGCTVIEMATGKPPWSEQYQEVAALFHIGTTKSHPPIPEHLSVEAKDFLLKCLQKEPNLRPTASELLRHPFVSGKYLEGHPAQTSMESGNHVAVPGTTAVNLMSYATRRSTCTGFKDIFELGGVRYSTVSPQSLSGAGSLWRPSNCDADMCEIDYNDDLVVSSLGKFDSALLSDDLTKSFNPICEPTDHWQCKYDGSPELGRSGMKWPPGQTDHRAFKSPGASDNEESDFKFSCGPSAADDDDEVTDSKIRSFLDEKAFELKRLQTPLYEEFYSTLNAAGLPNAKGTVDCGTIENHLKLPPKSRSPSQTPSRRLSAMVENPSGGSLVTGSPIKKVSKISSAHGRALKEIQPPQTSAWTEPLLDVKERSISSSASFSERQRRWKEELVEELERKRELLRRAGGVKVSSPKDHVLTRYREQLHVASPGK